MLKVKEFLNYQENQDEVINKWLSENENINIIDIKYSLGCFQASKYCNYAQEFSGVLIVYKENKN